MLILCCNTQYTNFAVLSILTLEIDAVLCSILTLEIGASTPCYYVAVLQKTSSALSHTYLLGTQIFFASARACNISEPWGIPGVGPGLVCLSPQSSVMLCL